MLNYRRKSKDTCHVKTFAMKFNPVTLLCAVIASYKYECICMQTLSNMRFSKRGTTGKTVGFRVVRSSIKARMSPWKYPIRPPCAKTTPWRVKNTQHELKTSYNQWFIKEWEIIFTSDTKCKVCYEHMNQRNNSNSATSVPRTLYV